MSDDLELGPDPNSVRKHVKKLYTEKEYRQRYCRLDFFKPNAKQLEFICAPAHLTEIRLQAATQSGKSISSMMCEAMDATANYLPWHTGKHFDQKQSIVRPHDYMSWVVTSSSQVQKATLQLNLIGNLDDPNGLGTGAIPLDYFIGKPVLSRGLQNVVDSVTVRRDMGGTGNIGFRTMEQSIAAFAGVSLDQVRWDEPGPFNLYLEAQARTTAVRGSRVVFTATPTEGRDAIYLHFEEPSPSRRTYRMSLLDVEHMSKEQVQAVIDRTPEVDRPMRIYGEPSLSAGSIYTTPIDQFLIDRDKNSFAEPWWRWAWSIDVTHGGTSAGNKSYFAACLWAYDESADCMYLVDSIKLHQALLPLQAASLASHPYSGRELIVLYPKDSAQPADAMTGASLYQAFRKLGINMASRHVQNERGVAPGLEDGIAEVATRLATGRLKVLRGNHEWFDEYRAYHRKDRKAVQVFCDLLDATRIGVIGIKQSRHLSTSPAHMRGQQVLHGSWGDGPDQLNIFTGQVNGSSL